MMAWIYGYMMAYMDFYDYLKLFSFHSSIGDNVDAKTILIRPLLVELYIFEVNVFDSDDKGR
jgi:hypothetical protein